MNNFIVTFKRIEAFYESIVIKASDEEKAREKAYQLSEDGQIEFDYLKESDVLEEYIDSIEKL